MKWEVQVTNVTSRLRKRTGPSTSYRVAGYINPGDKGIVVDVKDVGNTTWYKWEGTSLWSCGKTSSGTVYLKKTKDLEPLVTPTPANPVKEPEPTVDTTLITQATYMSTNTQTTGIANSLGTATTSWGWYKASKYESKNTNITTGDMISMYTDEQIEEEIRRIKYNMDISYNTSSEVYQDMGTDYYSNLQKKLFNSFNRNKVAYPDKELPKTFAYVFFTRPDLNILAMDKNGQLVLNTDNTNHDPKYAYLYNNNPWCLKSLSTNGNTNHKFLVLLSNEAKSFEVEDVVLKTVDHGETYTGGKIIYGRTDHESLAAGEINIRYIDTVNLDIYKLHLVWTDYINKVSRGIFRPKSIYIKNKILDYASSCYYFLCGPDGSTILYWQKLTGIFPVNTGENAFSWDSGTLLAKPEINIKYMYSMKTSMDILQLEEFNRLTRADDGILRRKEVYHPYNCQSGSTLTHSPYVEKIPTKVNGREIYRLIWLDNN